MIITDILVKNAREFPKDISLVEINPEVLEQKEKAWKEFDLVETGSLKDHRRELTWEEFNEQSNKFAKINFQDNDYYD